MRGCLYVFLTDLVFHGTRLNGQLVPGDLGAPGCLEQGVQKGSRGFVVWTWALCSCTGGIPQPCFFSCKMGQKLWTAVGGSGLGAVGLGWQDVGTGATVRRGQRGETGRTEARDFPAQPSGAQGFLGCCWWVWGLGRVGHWGPCGRQMDPCQLHTRRLL